MSRENNNGTIENSNGLSENNGNDMNLNPLNPASNNLNNPTDTRGVWAVRVKIPAFWTDRPQIWFAQIDPQFALANITVDSTKFNHLLAHLEPNIIENIWDIVSDTTETAKYEKTKERLIATYRVSEEKEFRILLSDLILGELKPSQLLRKMRLLAGGNITEKMLKQLWLDKLPSHFRNIIIISSESLDKLTEMADKIHEVAHVSKIDTPKPKQLTYEDQIESLTRKVSELESQISRKSMERSQNRRNSNRGRSRSRSRYQTGGKYCFFHFRFGGKCRPEKCIKPCQWENEKNNNYSLNVRQQQ